MCGECLAHSRCSIHSYLGYASDRPLFWGCRGFELEWKTSWSWELGSCYEMEGRKYGLRRQSATGGNRQQEGTFLISSGRKLLVTDPIHLLDARDTEAAGDSRATKRMILGLWIVIHTSTRKTSIVAEPLYILDSTYSYSLDYSHTPLSLLGVKGWSQLPSTTTKIHKGVCGNV